MSSIDHITMHHRAYIAPKIRLILMVKCLAAVINILCLSTKLYYGNEVYMN